MRYIVEVDTKAAREIRALPRQEQGRIIAKAQALAENPRPAGCVKLSGPLGLWRIRSGAYRIVYQIQDDRVLVTIVKVAHRREVYRGMQVMILTSPFSLERVVNAVERVRQRLLKSAAALKAAGVPYAVAGGNAVALWVSRVDEAAVRNTRGVDILIRRKDLDAARRALESAGFVHRHVAGVDVFLDGPDAKPRGAVHIVFANEKVRPQEHMPNPDVTESEEAELFCVLSLEALVRIKLTAFRDKDRTHLRDLIDVGLVDADWIARLPGVLADRLRLLLETPDG